MRAGWPPESLDADPRPSRLQALLNAVDVDDARRRLEDWDDRVNTNGVEGVREERDKSGKLKTYPSDTVTTLVGHEKRKAELHARAFPEDAQAKQAQEARQAPAPFAASRPPARRINAQALRARHPRP